MVRILLTLILVSFLTATTVAAGEWPVKEAGTLLIMNKSDNTVTLVGLDTGETLATLPTGTEPHEGATSPDGRIAVISNTDYQSDSGHTLTVVDLVERKVIGTIPLGHANPHGIEFFPDGKRVLVTVEGSDAVVVVNVEAGEVEQTISTDGNPCHMLKILPDGKRALATSINQGTLVALDLEGGDMIAALPTGQGAEGFDVAPDGRTVWVGNRAEDSVTIVDVETLSVLANVRAEGFPIRVKFANNGEFVLVSCYTANAVRVYNARKRSEIMAIPMPEGAAPIGLLVAPDQRHVFVANTRANLVTVVDLMAASVKTTLEAGNTPDGMAWALQ